MLTIKKNSLKFKDQEGKMQDVGVFLGKQETDISLSQSGIPADAKVVGDELDKLSESIPKNLSQFTNDAGYALESDIAIERARIDSLSTLHEGSTTGDAELQDIRIAFDGITYDSAGNAIREQFKDMDNRVKDLQQKKDFTSVDYSEDTYLLRFLDENGTDVYDPVYIKSGGGGGSTVSTKVTLTNQNGTSTFVIASGNSLDLMFNFTSTEDDIPTGDGSCQISVNGNLKTTFAIKQGLTTLDVSKYLYSGSNTVRVQCTDIYGNYKALVYNISVIDLKITSTFNSAVAYNSNITFKYTPYGAIEKTIHILIDGDEKYNFVTSASGKEITQIISALSHGVHKIEVYSDAYLEETYIKSQSLIYDVMCLEENDTTPMIASICNTSSTSQGQQISIPYIVYDPTKLACDITLNIYTIVNGNRIVYATQNLTVDRQQQYWNTRKYPIGEVYFEIKYGEISKTHKINVTELDIDIEAVTNDLELWLTSDGRSNNESDPAHWSYEGVTTTFQNMNWDSVGWVNDEEGNACLRLNGDAKAEINFKPFKDDLRTYGKTLEFDFVIRDVNNRAATPISCIYNGIGIEVKPDRAYINSEQSNVFCNYKTETRIRVSFVIQSKDEHRVLAVYLNGVQSDAIQYPTGDNFQQSEPVNITIGSPYCGIDIYNIRSYSTAFTHDGAVANFIADMSDIVKKSETFENNDIYDEYKNISFEKCKEKNSVMVLVGALPTYKGDKRTVAVKYYDVDDSELNFEENVVSIDVQGTSSQFFVRKNWKLKTQNEHYIDKDQLPIKVICIKVDYAEATGTHNTQNAVFVETLYDELFPAQRDNPKYRSTIYGKPILLFHQENEYAEPVFYGKANLNADKGAENLFGFTKDYDVECWEFKNNTSDACNFWNEIPYDWEEDFEARYPDGYDDISRFKLMHDWVISTNQSKATNTALPSAYTDVDGNEHTHDTAAYRLAKFKTEFENWFNMHFSLIYYVYTFFALMVDQRAKNMFLTYWASIGKWMPYFYDKSLS